MNEKPMKFDDMNNLNVVKFNTINSNFLLYKLLKFFQRPIAKFLNGFVPDN